MRLPQPFELFRERARRVPSKLGEIVLRVGSGKGTCTGTGEALHRPGENEVTAVKLYASSSNTSQLPLAIACHCVRRGVPLSVSRVRI